MIKRFYYWLRKWSAHPEGRGGPSSGLWQGKVRQAALKNCDIENGNVLDLGCGEGLFLKELIGARPGLRVFAADLSREQLLQAKERINAPCHFPYFLLQSDALRLAVKDDLFDKIICINFLINIPSDAALDTLLREIKRVCRPGGSVIFDIRNRSNPFVRLKYKFARFYDATVKNVPLRMYDLGGIEKKLHALGFGVSKIVPLGILPGRFSAILVIEATKR
jgi:ubiquinone/menaquinone biosynthesis C-methylase UbiE